jgi:hypothetical protein
MIQIDSCVDRLDGIIRELLQAGILRADGSDLAVRDDIRIQSGGRRAAVLIIVVDSVVCRCARCRSGGLYVVGRAGVIVSVPSP